jgi:enoyl-CoA hydratase
MQSFENLLWVLEDRILTLTINRESKLNALNSATLDELKMAFQSIYDDESIGAVILTGAGEKAFVAGADISEISQLTEVNSRKFAEAGQDIFLAIENCPKPVIAAVNGFALGGGCEIAMACHIRLASENAKFGLPEVKLGILPGYGGTQRMPQIVGKGKALEMMLTGDMISAADALQWGLVNYVLPTKDDLLQKCKELLKKMLKNSPSAIELIITATNAGTYNEVGFQAEANSFQRATRTEDFREGTNAFLEKREAKFTGK